MGEVKSIEEILQYYTNHGVMTDPGKYKDIFQSFPSDIGTLCSIIHGLLIHPYHIKQYNIELPPERKNDTNIRKAEDIITRILELDNHPINVARTPENRIEGVCRHFSVLLSAILREKGIPARARCGFAVYFEPDFYEDHWTCEYWKAEENRWVMVDPQLDEIQKNDLKISFDVLDVPSDQFLVGGKVWGGCRTGLINPDQVGFTGLDLKGLWYAEDNMLRDFMALNKLEILPWDENKFMELYEKSFTTEELELLDRVAELTIEADNYFLEVKTFQEMNKLFHKRLELHMPEDWHP